VFLQSHNCFDGIKIVGCIGQHDGIKLTIPKRNFVQWTAGTDTIEAQPL